MSIMEWNGMRDSIMLELGVSKSMTDKICCVLDKVQHRVADNTTYKIAKSLAMMEINIWNGRRY